MRCPCFSLKQYFNRLVCATAWLQQSNQLHNEPKKFKAAAAATNLQWKPISSCRCAQSRQTISNLNGNWEGEREDEILTLAVGCSSQIQFVMIFCDVRGVLSAVCCSCLFVKCQKLMIIFSVEFFSYWMKCVVLFYYSLLYANNEWSFISIFPNKMGKKVGNLMRLSISLIERHASHSAVLCLLAITLIIITHCSLRLTTTTTMVTR